MGRLQKNNPCFKKGDKVRTLSLDEIKKLYPKACSRKDRYIYFSKGGGNNLIFTKFEYLEKEYIVSHTTRNTCRMVGLPYSLSFPNEIIQDVIEVEKEFHPRVQLDVRGVLRALDRGLLIVDDLDDITKVVIIDIREEEEKLKNLYTRIEFQEKLLGRLKSGTVMDAVDDLKKNPPERRESALATLLLSKIRPE